MYKCLEERVFGKCTWNKKDKDMLEWEYLWHKGLFDGLIEDERMQNERDSWI